MSIDIYSADAFHCQEVPLSMLASVTDSAEHGFYGGVNNYVRYGDFVGLLHASAKHRQFPYKEAAPLFSPTIYNLIPNQIGSDGKPCRGYRNFPNATVARLLVIDADQGLTIGEACQRCEQAGIEAILYTTASNRSGDRFRVVVPLAGTVDVETQKAALRSFCAFLKPGWSPDTSKWNCYSLFYVPGRYAGANNEFFHLPGEVRSAEDWCRRYPVAEDKPAEPTEGAEYVLSPDAEWSIDKCPHLVGDYNSLSSERHVGLFRAMVSIAMSAINHGYDIDARELASIGRELQDGNPPSRPENRRNWSDLLRAAASALRSAHEHVTEPSFLRKCERAKYLDEREAEFRREQAEFDEAPEADSSEELGADEPIPDDREEPALPAHALIWDAGEEDDEQIPPRQWLLGNVVCRRFLSLLFGPGGAGKSSMALASAMSMATTKQLIGENVFQHCRVLYVSMEDDKDEMRRRIKACRVHHNVSKQDLKAQFFVYNISKGKKLATVNKKGQIEEGKLAAELTEIIKQQKIDVIVLDPFKKTHGCPENDNTAIDQVADMLTNMAIELDIAAVVLHHVAKGRNEAGDPDIGRGASALKDAARLGFTLTPMSGGEAERLGIQELDRWSYVRFDPAKVNIAPRAEDAKWFRLVGVNLHNETTLYPNGDNVQAVERVQLVSIDNEKNNKALLLAIFTPIIREPCKYSEDARIKEPRYQLMQFFEAYDPQITKAQAKQLVGYWLKKGHLEKGDYSYIEPSGRRRNHKGLQLGPNIYNLLDNVELNEIRTRD